MNCKSSGVAIRGHGGILCPRLNGEKGGEIGLNGETKMRIRYPIERERERERGW